jgi:predicted ATPase
MNLIGRDAELKLVREHLRAGKNLAVYGPSGVGKTALVQAALAGRKAAVYCADTATLKTACELLLAQLGLRVAEADNVQRKRAVLQALRRRRSGVVFDQVGRVSPKLLSLLENLHESHPLIVVTRSLAWKDIGHLKMILYNFDTLELTNLSEPDARQLVRGQIHQLGLTVPNPTEFEHDLWRLSHGNPGRILSLCQQAKQGHYAFGRRLDTRLLDLDRRIKSLNLP